MCSRSLKWIVLLELAFSRAGHDLATRFGCILKESGQLWSAWDEWVSVEAFINYWMKHNHAPGK